MKNKKVAITLATLSIGLIILLVIFATHQKHSSEPRVFKATVTKIRTESVMDDGDDGWSISGKTKAPDGSLVAVYDPKTTEKPKVINFDYGPVKNGKFEVSVSGESLTNTYKLKNGDSIPVVVVAISHIKVKDNNSLTIPKNNINDVKKKKSNANLNVNKAIQINSANASSRTEDQVNKTLEEAQKPSRSLQDKVNETLSNKLKQRKNESSSEHMLNYISSMTYLKNDDGTVGIRINFKDTTDLSDNQRYKIAIQGQQVARQALNSMQSNEVNKKFKLTDENGHRPYVEAGDTDNLAYISDPSTHVIAH